uniref:hypothetical protein n=1 Tax=Duffyella gerundensis TaxID=1619313 RepID=UPI0021F7D171
SNDIIVSMGWMDSNKEAVFELYKKIFKDKISVFGLPTLFLLTSKLRIYIIKLEVRNLSHTLSGYHNIVIFLLFGGETAKQDALVYQKEIISEVPMEKSIKFGSDIIKIKKENSINDSETLRNLEKRTGDFVITVGSIEAEKITIFFTKLTQS